MSVALARHSTVHWSRLSLAAGLAGLAVLWLGPLVPLSHIAFSAHMVLHLGLMVVVAPLLAIAVAPYLPTPIEFGEAIRWYLLAAAFEMLVVWSWHIPVLHDAAGHDSLAFAIEQVSFLACGVALWAAIFSARSAGAAAAAALVAALTFSHMSMFGMLLSLAPRLIYDPNLCQGWLGLARLDDQHMGGVLMATAGLVYLIAAVALGARALGRLRQA